MRARRVVPRFGSVTDRHGLPPPPDSEHEHRSARLDRLHPVYAEALALRDAGASHDAIAQHLDVPLESVRALLDIATAKLAPGAASPAAPDRAPGP
jgi:DNA-directed RNA polymerase specialized sigma24 family protein